MVDDVRITISGIPELKAALRHIDAQLPRELQRRLKQQVADPAAASIRAAIPVGPAAGGHWRSDISAGSNSKGAFVTWGRTERPYAGWVEFGGTIRQPRRGVTLRRPRISGGRYVYPTVRRKIPDLERAALQAVTDVARSAGFTR